MGSRVRLLFGVNDVVSALYSDIRNSYLELHGASVAVRHETGTSIPLADLVQDLDEVRDHLMSHERLTHLRAGHWLASANVPSRVPGERGLGVAASRSFARKNSSTLTRRDTMMADGNPGASCVHFVCATDLSAIVDTQSRALTCTVITWRRTCPGGHPGLQNQ